MPAWWAWHAIEILRALLYRSEQDRLSALVGPTTSRGHSAAGCRMEGREAQYGPRVINECVGLQASSTGTVTSSMRTCWFG